MYRPRSRSLVIPPKERWLGCWALQSSFDLQDHPNKVGLVVMRPTQRGHHLVTFEIPISASRMAWLEIQGSMVEGPCYSSINAALLQSVVLYQAAHLQSFAHPSIHLPDRFESP